MAISRESKTCRPCELVTITRVNAGFSHFSPIVGVFTHFSEAKSVNFRCYICIYARNIYSALPPQHLSKLPPNQVLNWLCHHKYFVGFACTKNITRVPITTLRPPNDFAWKSFPWTANIIKPFFSPSFQLNVNVMHSVAGALCLNTRFQSRLHSLAFSGRQLFNPCARLNPWEIFEGGLLWCADSPWLINHIFLRNRWDDACEYASPTICKIFQFCKMCSST